MSKSGCPSLNTLCQHYLDHLDEITRKFGKNHQYTCFYSQDRIGLYDYQRKGNQELIKIRDIINRHLDTYKQEYDFMCLLTIEDCVQVSMIYTHCFSVMMDFNKVSMIKYSNWWSKKCLKLGVSMAPLTSVYNCKQLTQDSINGDQYSLYLQEKHQKKKISQLERKKVSILEITLRELEYWRDLENFWVFLGSSVLRNFHKKIIKKFFTQQDIVRLISSFVFKKDNSFDQIEFYQCYQLSHQLFTGFFRTEIVTEHGQSAVSIKQLGERKARKKFPNLWKKNPRTAQYLACQTMCLDKSIIQNKLQTLEQYYSGTL